MLDSKLTRLKELIDIKEKTDAEIAKLLGASDAPRRGRPKKEETGEGGVSSE